MSLTSNGLIRRHLLSHVVITYAQRTNPDFSPTKRLKFSFRLLLTASALGLATRMNHPAHGSLLSVVDWRTFPVLRKLLAVGTPLQLRQQNDATRKASRKNPREAASRHRRA